MITLRIAHGAIRRGGRTVLESCVVTCVLPAAVAVVGVNGSGKTSLFMHLTRTLARRGAAAGIAIAGCVVTRIGYVPQTPALPMWLSVEHAARVFGCGYAQLCDTMAGLYLDELRGKRVAGLSLGQRQTLALAIAMGTGAPLLILDEPFAALDFRRRIGALALLDSWKNASPQRALVVSSQNAADLFDLCDHYVVIRDGTYVFNGSRTELVADAAEADPLRACESRILQLLT